MSALAPEQPAQETIAQRDGLIPLIDRSAQHQVGFNSGQARLRRRKRENRERAIRKATPPFHNQPVSYFWQFAADIAAHLRVKVRCPGQAASQGKGTLPAAHYDV